MRSLHTRFIGLIFLSFLTACGGDKVAGTADVSKVQPTGTDDFALDLSANRTAGVVGDSVVLEWRSLEASACEASGDWTGIRTRTGTEMVALKEARSYVFTLTCKNGAQTVTRSAAVDVKVAAEKAASSSPEAEEIQKLFKILQEFDKV